MSPTSLPPSSRASRSLARIRGLRPRSAREGDRRWLAWRRRSWSDSSRCSWSVRSPYCRAPRSPRSSRPPRSIWSDIRDFRELARINRHELVLALLATAGVVWIGVLQGVVIAVGATLAHLVAMAARPRDGVMGRAPGGGSLVTLRRDPQARQSAQILVYLFESSLFFVNAEYFGDRVRLALKAEPATRYLVLDTSVMMHADSMAVAVLDALDRGAERARDRPAYRRRARPLPRDPLPLGSGRRDRPGSHLHHAGRSLRRSGSAARWTSRHRQRPEESRAPPKDRLRQISPRPCRPLARVGGSTPSSW